ncbi:hypothetical protein F5Y07DRAFT_399381 [Xylaria sp. FL0933]|nr:hypothetical protein F5Y07DRAFT_399381 [Xylaria sp. FL0933]
MKFFLVTLTAALASLTLAEPVADPAADPVANPDSPETAHWPPPPPPPVSTSTSTPGWIITTLPPPTTTTAPGKPTVTPTPVVCPTVTITTRPAGCQPIRCPIPGCTQEEDMIVPCNCSIRTLLWVEGCQTECPAGCATRTSTLSQLCHTATATLATPSVV